MRWLLLLIFISSLAGCGLRNVNGDSACRGPGLALQLKAGVSTFSDAVALMGKPNTTGFARNGETVGAWTGSSPDCNGVAVVVAAFAADGKFERITAESGL